MLCRFDSEDNPSQLILTEAAKESQLFNSMPSHVLDNLQKESLAMENHHWGNVLSFEYPNF